MNITVALIVIAGLTVLSYLYSLAFRYFRIPSVLLLIATGFSLRYAAPGISFFSHTTFVLQVLGSVALVLIVLEAGLDLRLSRDRAGIIGKALLSAVGILLLCSFLFGVIIYLFHEVSFRVAYINGFPLAVISSAVAIPSIPRHLDEKSREFLIYEATFSDIVGIMVFFFVVQHERFDSEAVMAFTGGLFITVAVSVVSAMLLLALLNRIRLQVKFFLIFSVLILAYALGKYFHLSTLLLILMFGVVMNNAPLFVRGALRRMVDCDRMEGELHLLKLITAESSFLVRTFFFILFGYSIDMSSVWGFKALLVCTLISVGIYAVRYLFLRFAARAPIFPELFIAPRGLVTIFLFYSIPSSFLIKGFTDGMLFLVIVVTSLVMTFGVMTHRKGPDEPVTAGTPEEEDIQRDLHN
ncbi:MAG TPA: cation:proton antiporter [bacterium]|nr:cation:proton antiporter [bacterium]